MNAETGTETESPKRRGRIPQSAWPRILERYRSGATLSAIAREFECTPSAISYIVRKAGATGAAPDEAEGQITEDAATETPDADAAAPTPPAAAEVAAPTPQPPAAEPAPAVAEAAPTPTPAPAPAPVRPKADAPRGTLRADQLRGERPPRGEAPGRSEPPAPPAPPAAPPAAEAPEGGPAAASAQPAPRAARGEPTPPVDAVEARLRETARTCLAAYRTWRQQPGENSIQPLADAVHELRKALARIEIDMSASRREEQVARPIPIPAHRAARRTP